MLYIWVESYDECELYSHIHLFMMSRVFDNIRYSNTLYWNCEALLLGGQCNVLKYNVI